MKLILHLALAAVALSFSEGVMVCYFGSWAKYRWGDGQFDVENIDPTICTHIIFSFAGLDGTTNQIKALDPYNELCENWGRCAYDRFTALKQQNSDLKALLAVGGWTEGSTTYSLMAADPAKRKMFTDSCIALVKKHNFDGIDMDWEYPAFRGGAPQDQENFVTLLREMKTALHAEGMLLTAAVGAGKDKMDNGYDIAGVAANLDLVNLMTYDLHGPWDKYTHHQSALYEHPQDKFNNNSFLNVDFAVNYWLDHGTPKEKLTVGVPMYGQCWTLDSETDTGFYAKASQAGTAGKYTRQAGFMGYNEICESQKETPWTVVYDPSMHEPYAYNIENNKIWCSYEDARSARIKAQYIKDKGLAGVMIWSIETDDFKGNCHPRPFHITKTLYETFLGKDIPVPPTSPPVPVTTAGPDAPTTTTTTTTRAPTTTTTTRAPTTTTTTLAPTTITTRAPTTTTTTRAPTTTTTTRAPTTTTTTRAPTTTTTTRAPTTTTTTRAPTTTTTTRAPTTTTTTQAPIPPQEHCTKLGANSDSVDCSHFFLCSQTADGSFIESEVKCPSGLLFNPVDLVCDWNYHVCALGRNVCPNSC